jgi:hypothetical protein
LPLFFNFMLFLCTSLINFDHICRTFFNDERIFHILRWSIREILSIIFILLYIFIFLFFPLLYGFFYFSLKILIFSSFFLYFVSVIYFLKFLFVYMVHSRGVPWHIFLHIIVSYMFHDVF